MRDSRGSGDNSKTEAGPPFAFEHFPASPHRYVDVASNDWASDSILSEGSASIDMKSDTDLPRFSSVSDLFWAPAVRVTVYQQQPSNDDGIRSAAAAVTWFADNDGKRDDASEIESMDEWHSIIDVKRTSVSDSEVELTDWHASIDGSRRTSVSGSEIESTGWRSSRDTQRDDAGA
jgi:hypothetical protein